MAQLRLYEMESPTPALEWNRKFNDPSNLADHRAKMTVSSLASGGTSTSGPTVYVQATIVAVPKPKTYSLRLIHYTSIPLVPTMPYPTST
jgi:hypothetical protein